MTIKASKCHSFGICKKGTTSTQYKPKLYLDNALVPPVKLDDCFTYLGRHFDFKMSDDKHKSELLETISDQIDIIDTLPLHPKNKLKLYQQWTLSEISWHLTVIKISNTWMKNNIDNIVSWYIRLWLEIPVNGTLNIVTQSKRKFGLGVTRHTQCQVTFRNKLRKSGNHNIREIDKSTSNVNIQYDQFNSTRDALKHIRSSDVSCIMEKLTIQSLVVKSIWELVDGRFINQWSNVIIFNFTIHYLNNTLASSTNAIK